MTVRVPSGLSSRTSTQRTSPPMVVTVQDCRASARHARLDLHAVAPLEGDRVDDVVAAQARRGQRHRDLDDGGVVREPVGHGLQRARCSGRAPSADRRRPRTRRARRATASTHHASRRAHITQRGPPGARPVELAHARDERPAHAMPAITRSATRPRCCRPPPPAARRAARPWASRVKVNGSSPSSVSTSTTTIEPGLHVAEQDLLAERVLDLALDRATQRTRTQHRVVAAVREQRLGRRA